MVLRSNQLFFRAKNLLFFILTLLISGIDKNLVAYEPEQLKGKYQFGTIESNLCSENWYWIRELKNSSQYNGDINSVRRSLVPSAMVDKDGDMFTVYPSYIGQRGLQLALGHYKSGKHAGTLLFYPWNRIGTTVSNNQSTPQYKNEVDKNLFSRAIHNILQPCLIQEVDYSNGYLYCCIYVPPTHYANATSDVYGLATYAFSKKPFSIQQTSFVTTDELKIDYQAYREPYCKSYLLPPQKGNFQGFFTPYGNQSQRIEFFYFNVKKGIPSIYEQRITHGTSILWPYCQNIGPQYTSHNQQVGTRFIKVGSYVYGMFQVDGYYNYLMRISPNSSFFLKSCISLDIYLETQRWGSSGSPYPADFCLLEKNGTPCTPDSPDNTNAYTQKILVFFGLVGGGIYSFLATKEMGWTATYCNWQRNYTTGCLGSLLLEPNNGHPQMDQYNIMVYLQNEERFIPVQNTIYNTQIARCNNGNVAGVDTDTYKTNYEHQLFLNSHRLVPYHSPSGNNYLIYAYCYPGKKTHLYLGYASYTIDSKYRLRLLTKTEFKANSSDSYGDSFGNFTSCWQIISMDLKNNHLWITFMNANSTEYRYFHILASDLIQE